MANYTFAHEFYVDVIGLEVYRVEPCFNKDPESLGYAQFETDDLAFPK